MIKYGCVTSSQLNPPAFCISRLEERSRYEVKFRIAPVTISPGEGASDSCQCAPFFAVGIETSEIFYFYHTRRCSRRVRSLCTVTKTIRKHDERMANEEVLLGPRKTMFVLVIVVGCFAVLWPRILSPLILGHTRNQLKPNQFDRDAGCCEVMFEAEMAVLELLNEVCSSAVHVDGKLSPYAAAECRKAVNDTCGVDIAAFLKRSENVGKNSKMLVNTMKKSNSSCLKEHFGVPVYSLTNHQALNSWALQDTVKQERPAVRAGPHPALRERGRAIPAGAPPAPKPVSMPPHVRVRSSPLSVYYELEVKPPPIPGMRPPLGSPGGPVTAPKSSMGFVMPIYTICIIVFFVYTLSKILFKRTGPSPYETITPDPQFRRRVFRDDSRSSPDKLVVSAISGLVAEVQQQMDASYVQTQSQQRQDPQDNARPYTNGTILHNSGPVHIVASEYQDSKEKAKESTPEPKQSVPEFESTPELKDISPEAKEVSPEPKEPTPETETVLEPKEITPEPESSPELNETTPESVESTPEPKELTPEIDIEATIDNTEEDPEQEVNDLVKLTDNLGGERDRDVVSKSTEEFLREESKVASENTIEEKQSTPDLLEEAIKEDSPEEDEVDQDNASVKVVGMEITAHSADGGSYRAPLPALPQTPSRPAHEAEQVQSIYLETEIPQKSRVLVTEFAEDKIDKPTPARNSPMVVSGKMTLSLIQDARDTPEKDLESTVDDFTTASAVTQNAAEKEDDLSDDEEIEEEIEIEEIEEEVSEEELEVEELDEEPKEEVHQKTGPEDK